MEIKEKAKLIIELMKEYFKDTEYYDVLCSYDEDNDLILYSGHDNGHVDFGFIVGNEDIILDIDAACIYKVYVDHPHELIKVARFDEVIEIFIQNNQESWDVTIEYLQKQLRSKGINE